MKVADVDGIEPKPAARCVARPRPQHSRDKDEQHSYPASPEEKHAQGGVKTAYEERQDGGGADIHQASIRSLSGAG
jgi:hypothetical protein